LTIGLNAFTATLFQHGDCGRVLCSSNEFRKARHTVREVMEISMTNVSDQVTCQSGAHSISRPEIIMLAVGMAWAAFGCRFQTSRNSTQRPGVPN